MSEMGEKGFERLGKLGQAGSKLGDPVFGGVVKRLAPRKDDAEALEVAQHSRADGSEVG